jgi:glycosyltransferase involved in cell wall biosynthesis
MRIAVISHSCVVAVNQRLIVALADTPGVEAVELLIPANWRNEYTGEAQSPTVLPEVTFPVHMRPVIQPGHVSLHTYRSLPLHEWKAFRPDVVYAAQEPWSMANLQASYLSRRLGAPLVFHTNQNILKRYPPPFSWFEQMAYRRAGAALAYSEEARQVMVSKGLRRSSAVVPYAVELSQFYPDKDAAATLRESLSLRPDEMVIGYMGRFVPDKGLDTLVRAVAQMQKLPGDVIPAVRVLMVGAGSEEGALKALAQDLGVAERFVWTGLVPHHRAGEYLRCMDVFVLPSITMPNWKEQFGRVLIEAMACGVPVIGSDSGQIPYLIRGTGGGLVFPEKDASALAGLLWQLAVDPERRASLGRAGRMGAEEQYRTEAVAAQMVTVFAKLSGGSAGNANQDAVSSSVVSMGGV